MQFGSLRCIVFSLIAVMAGFLQAETLGNQAGELRWMAGAARVEITPAESMWMAGYAARDHASEGTLHPLYARALALKDSSGRKAVFISADLRKFSLNMVDYICTRLETEYGLERDQILITVTHTHSGPVVRDQVEYDIYGLTAPEIRKIERYTDWLQIEIVEMAGRALQNMQPAVLSAANGVTRFAVNRRENDGRSLLRTETPDGPFDHAVPVLKVTGSDGVLLSAAFGYACHATTLNMYRWSGDYPGVAQMELESDYPGSTALFFAGCGGDINPIPRRTEALATQYGRTLAAAVDRVLQEPMPPLSPVLRTAYQEIDLKLNPPPAREELEEFRETGGTYQKRWAKHLLGKLDSGRELAATYPYPIQIWQLGEQLVIALGGEVVVEYAIRLKQLLGYDIFVLGYSNDVMSYIPSTGILREGGYEGQRSQVTKGMPNTWAADIEEHIISAVLRMVNQLQIPLPESPLMGR